MIKRRVVFTPLASADIETAYRWYESQRPGMGEHFRATLNRLWQLLELFPDAGPIVRGKLQRVRFRS